MLGVCNIVVERIQRAGVQPWVCSESADHMEISCADKSCRAIWLVHLVHSVLGINFYSYQLLWPFVCHLYYGVRCIMHVCVNMI